MGRSEHIHIISAGEDIHTTYPASFRMLPTITHTYVFADSEVYTKSSDHVMEERRLAVRHAVDAVKEISLSLAIPFTRETIFTPAYPSVRTILMKIHRDNPGARYTFDLSGGSKPLCMALFTCAPWLNGEVYSTFDEKMPRGVPLPDRFVRNMMDNPNYPTILSVLIRKGTPEKEVAERPMVSRRYLFLQVWPYYQRSRVRAAVPMQPGAQAPRYKKGHKPANDLSQPMFSTFLSNLKKAGLIEEAPSGKNRKEKAYWITEAGETAFRFYADPATNSSVKIALEGPEAGPKI